LPLFIFDTQLLDRLEDNRDARLDFICREVLKLKESLEREGSSIIVRYGNPVDVFKELVGIYKVQKVYANSDYEPYARSRDEKVLGLLKEYGAGFQLFKDQVVFEKDEILKDNGKPYTVFTPYAKKWRARISPGHLALHDFSAVKKNLFRITPQPMITLKQMGFKPGKNIFPSREVNRETLASYSERRDFPALEGTSRLSIHLRFGTVSIRKLVMLAQEISESWLNELVWREFYKMILWHFPKVEDHSFKPAYENIPWRNNEAEFAAWCAGKTGYPIVDAGMRELNNTGFMHNRVRMITASFLVKHLLIDWRWGEAYFASKLLDYELSSNNGGWQWAAGSGCDAAPYFRVFNPTLQTEKFDPDREYIRQWVPEFREAGYPQPIVEHKFARERAIEVYKEALNQ
jgi:deoxyribodipyrimidine photo-lyase